MTSATTCDHNVEIAAKSSARTSPGRKDSKRCEISTAVPAQSTPRRLVTSSINIQGCWMSAVYSISAPDCDVHYFASAPDSLFCSECDSYVGDEDFVPQLDLRGCKLDFCFTYDGRFLVSERAKKHLSEHCTTSLTFTAVDTSARYYALRVGPTVLFDSDRRKTRFERKCPRCGNFESIVGATPAFILDEDKVETTGAYKSDICFGSGREKSPVIVIGATLQRELEAVFPELDFREVNPSLK